MSSLFSETTKMYDEGQSAGFSFLQLLKNIVYSEYEATQAYHARYHPSYSETDHE